MNPDDMARLGVEPGGTGDGQPGRPRAWSSPPGPTRTARGRRLRLAGRAVGRADAADAVRVAPATGRALAPARRRPRRRARHAPATACARSRCTRR